MGYVSFREGIMLRFFSWGELASLLTVQRIIQVSLCYFTLNRPWVISGVILLPTQTMHLYKGNPSNLPYICINFDLPQTGFI